jgi:Eco57I restriction-modification methylase
MMDIDGLVKKYENDIGVYRSSKYNETQLRTDFLDPLFTLLGWDITNSSGKPTNEREVLVEEGLKAKKGANTKKPDYTFRLFSERKFFLEAKKPYVDVSTDPLPAKQVRRYGFTAKLKISVLSNFEYLAIYDCSSAVNEHDPVQHSRVRLYHYSEYSEKLDEIYHLISRDVVYNGEFDKEWSAIEDKISRFSVDTLFLQQINEWRLNLAQKFIEIKPNISDLELNDLTQLYINSIVFLRVCEDRDLEEYETLFSFAEQEDYPSLIEKLNEADKKYNSGLFSLEYIDEFISDKNSYIWVIIKHLYYPESTYSFSVFSSDILGNIYEIFLGEKITFTSNEIKIIPKAENVDRDIVTTPTHIIKDILRSTVVEYCKDKTDQEILSSKFADIACGSGAFLLELFQTIQDVLVDYYLANDQSKLQPITHCTFKLKYDIKQEVLVSCIYGIDKDLNAVKAAEFGLLLKLLEGEDNSTISVPALPKLEKNIFFGNSLIESNIVKPEYLEDINPFDFNDLKFDVIVGNPPYLATEKMNQITPLEFPLYKKIYKSAYKQYDKYYLFVERAFSLLNKGGKFGYILPSKFMKLNAGINLRGLLLNGRLIDKIIYFGANQIFKGKTTYTCLLICTKLAKSEFYFIDVSNLRDWKTRKNIELAASKVDYKALSKDPWVLDSETLKILNRMYENTQSLESILGKKTIENGIQTSANKEYIHVPDDEDNDYIYFTYGNQSYQVEKELTRPYFMTVRNKAESLYTYRQVQPNSFVIYPYQKIDGQIRFVELDDIQKRYPYLYQFLQVVKDKLKRDTRSIEPAPKTDNEWHRYGRHQAFEKCDVPLKIVVGVNSSGYKYAIDTKRTFISSGGTAGYCPITIPEGNKYSIFYIQALLSSRYLEWFALQFGEVFRGGFIARGTKVLKKMPIVVIDFDDANEKKQHDDIAKLQELMNDTFEAIDANPNNERLKTPLKRKFSRLTDEMEIKLRDLFDLAEFEPLIPSIPEIYNKADQD